MIVFRSLLEGSKNEQTESLTSILKSAVFIELFHDGWNPYSSCAKFCHQTARLMKRI